MERLGVKQCSLIDRLEILTHEFGQSVAQTFVASGEPDDEPSDLTFAEFAGEVRRRSNALVSLGVGLGDIVAFAAPLSETSYPTLIAGMATATLAPLNYFLEAAALIRIVKASGARILLIHRAFEDGPDILDKLKQVHDALPYLRFLSFGSGAEVEGAVDIESIAAAQPSSSWHSALRHRSRDHVVALFHTGGTTGLPKLVPHTEAMYDAAIESCGVGEGAAPGESMLAGLPLFHTSGALQAGIVPLFNGVQVVIPSARGFRDPKAISNYWRFVRRYGISIGASVPTILAALTAIEPDGPVTSLKRMLVGASPVARATIAKIAEMTAGAEIIEGWGMTETCGFSVMNPHGRTKVGSVGLPFPGVEIEIRRFSAGGSAGQVCGADEIGELLVRGDIVIKHYFDDRPGSFTQDGWLRTGDLGRIDEDGYLWITGRLKDIIIRSGHNIDPAIIEEPAYQHPAVQLAAAIGKPDRYAGELPVLYVQLKPGAHVSEQELEAFVRGRIVERAATPKSVVIIPQIPVSGVGKISKLHLRREAISGVFQQELDHLALGELKIRAETVDDGRSGEVVMLFWAGVKPDAHDVQKVAAALDGYAIPFQWADAETAND